MTKPNNKYEDILDGSTEETPLTKEVLQQETARSFTKSQFCAIEGMSLSTYAKLQKMGKGPDELRFAGMNFVRITAKAREDWHKRMDEERKTDEAQLERARRSEALKRLGKLAAASPAHVSKTKAKKSARETA